MSTDSHGPEPQGNAGGSAGKDDDVDSDTPAPPMRAGARTRQKPDRRSSGRSAPPRRRRKARRVHRVVHHLDIWSVAKVASIFVLCAYVVGMISGFLLWRAADRVGTIDGIEGFMEDTGGYDIFVLDGSVVFSSALVIGLILGVLTIVIIVLIGILFNLISDLTGGIRMTVIDEDLIVTPARRGRPTPPLSDDRAVPDWPGPPTSDRVVAPEPDERPAPPAVGERPPPPISEDAPTETQPSVPEQRPDEPASRPAEPTSPDAAATPSPSTSSRLEIDFG